MKSSLTDFNGRGRSEGAFEDSDVFNQIEDAIAVLNHVRDAYDPLEISHRNDVPRGHARIQALSSQWP